MSEDKNNVWSIMTGIINQLWNQGDPDKAVLAALRNSKNLQSRSAIQAWPVLLAKLPASDLSTDGRPTVIEQAVFTALRCYALYQQGKEVATFDSQGPDLFSVLAIMRTDDDLRPALDRRVKIILGSRNYNGMVIGLVHLVQIIKTKGNRQPINFAALAQDLQNFQYDNDQARRVALKWGTQYYQQSPRAPKQ